MSKWNGDQARDRIAKRIVEHGDSSGKRVTSEEAHRQSTKIVQRKDRKEKK